MSGSEGVVEWGDWLVGEERLRGAVGAGQAMAKSRSAAKGNRSMSWTVGKGGVDVVVAGAGLKSRGLLEWVRMAMSTNGRLDPPGKERSPDAWNASPRSMMAGYADAMSSNVKSAIWSCSFSRPWA